LSDLNAKIKEYRIGGECGTRGGEGTVYKASAGKSEGKRSLGRRRRRCEDNIENDIKEIEWE
jgi:hypothetical protein